ncbi:hypothetical protein ACSSS7_006306 [Eimeria intestinalis]
MGLNGQEQQELQQQQLPQQEAHQQQHQPLQQQPRQQQQQQPQPQQQQPQKQQPPQQLQTQHQQSRGGSARAVSGGQAHRARQLSHAHPPPAQQPQQQPQQQQQHQQQQQQQEHPDQQQPHGAPPPAASDGAQEGTRRPSSPQQQQQQRTQAHQQPPQQQRQQKGDGPPNQQPSPAVRPIGVAGGRGSGGGGFGTKRQQQQHHQQQQQQEQQDQTHQQHSTFHQRGGWTGGPSGRTHPQQISGERADRDGGGVSRVRGGGGVLGGWTGGGNFRGSRSPLSSSAYGPHRFKLCPWFPEGRCNYGDQCNFAHSEKELRSGLSRARCRNTHKAGSPPAPGHQQRQHQGGGAGGLSSRAASNSGHQPPFARVSASAARGSEVSVRSSSIGFASMGRLLNGIDSGEGPPHRIPHAEHPGHTSQRGASHHQRNNTQGGGASGGGPDSQILMHDASPSISPLFPFSANRAMRWQREHGGRVNSGHHHHHQQQQQQGGGESPPHGASEEPPTPAVPQQSQQHLNQRLEKQRRYGLGAGGPGAPRRLNQGCGGSVPSLPAASNAFHEEAKDGDPSSREGPSPPRAAEGRFQGEGSEPPPPPNSQRAHPLSYNGGGPPAAADLQQHNEDKPAMCPYVNRRGGCYRENDCRFSHAREAGGGPPSLSYPQNSGRPHRQQQRHQQQYESSCGSRQQPSEQPQRGGLSRPQQGPLPREANERHSSPEARDVQEQQQQQTNQQQPQQQQADEHVPLVFVQSGVRRPAASSTYHFSEESSRLPYANATGRPQHQHHQHQRHQQQQHHHIQQQQMHQPHLTEHQHLHVPQYPPSLFSQGQQEMTRSLHGGGSLSPTSMCAAAGGGAPFYPLGPPPHPAGMQQLGPLGGSLESHYWFHLLHAQNGYMGHSGCGEAAPPPPYVGPHSVGIGRTPAYGNGGLRYVYRPSVDASLPEWSPQYNNPFSATAEELNAAAPRHYED